MMRVFLILLSFLCGVCASWGADFTLRGESYIQRIILDYDGSETPLTAYVKSYSNGTISVLLDSSAGWLVKISLDKDGEVSMIESSKFLPLRLARKFVLRDVCAILGILANIDADVVRIKENADGSVSELSFDDWRAEFSEYYESGNCKKKFPKTIKVECCQYKLHLTLVSVKARK